MDFVFIYSSDFYLYCLDAETGENIWKYYTDTASICSPAVASGKIYISTDNNLFCIDIVTGRRLWEFPKEDIVTEEVSNIKERLWYTDVSPTITGEYLYVRFFNRRELFCINASTGEEIWEIKPQGAITTTPVASAGHLYIGTADGYLYCYTHSEELPPSMFIDPSNITIEEKEEGKILTNKITIRNSGSGTLKCILRTSEKWITVSPTSFEGNNQVIEVTISTLGFKPGKYIGYIYVSSQVEDRAVSIYVIIAEKPPKITVLPSSLDFKEMYEGEKKTLHFTVKNEGGGLIRVQVRCSSRLLKVSPTSFTSNEQVVTVTVDTTTAELGSNICYIYLSSDVEDLSVLVTLKVVTSKTPINIKLTIGERSALVDKKIISLEVAPIIKSGRTVVPLRFIGEAFGADINWDGKVQKITISINVKMDERFVELWIGKKQAFVKKGGKSSFLNLDVAPFIVQGRTLVPLRFIADAFNSKITYTKDPKTKLTSEIFITFEP